MHAHMVFMTADIFDDYMAMNVVNLLRGLVNQEQAAPQQDQIAPSKWVAKQGEKGLR